MLLFNKKEELPEIENKIVNDLKSLTLDIINTKKNGNLDYSLDLIETLYTLYSKHLNIDTSNPNYINRDRVILSTATAYPALLATLYMSGFNISLDKLKDSYKTDAFVPGIDIISDKFGSGLSTSVGIAIGEKYLNNHFKNNNLFNFYTYVIASNLDLIKGISYASLSYAGALKLNKLIIFYDNNNESLGKIEKEIFNIDTNKYFESLNFNTIEVNKYNVLEIDNAIKKAKESDKPTIIILKHDNNKYKFENNYLNNKYLLTDEELSKMKNELEVRDIPFTISSDTKEKMEEIIKERTIKNIENFNKEYNKLEEEQKQTLDRWQLTDLSLDKSDINYEIDEEDTLEDAVYKILNNLTHDNPFIMGGVSNFDNSINEKLSIDNFNSNNYQGQLLNYGLRENIIGEIQNGLNLSNLRNYSISSTRTVIKLIPAITKASYLRLNNIYILIEETEEMIDGIDTNLNNQLITLRNIPNLDVYRPNDINELIGSLKIAVNKKDSPSCIIVSRKKNLVKEDSSISDVKKGAYIIKKENKNLSAILMSSGIDLDITLDVANILIEKGYDIRVISIPSTTLFEKQKKDYKEELLPLGTKVFVIENSQASTWYEYVYNDKYLITPDKVNWYKNDNEIPEFKQTILEKIENLLN